MLNKNQYKRIKHIGALSERQEYSASEKAFALLWEKENTRQPGHGAGTLETILQDKKYAPLGFPIEKEITQRDAYVAATVVQWLGTNCGLFFLEKVEKLIEKYEPEYKEKREKAIEEKNKIREKQWEIEDKKRKKENKKREKARQKKIQEALRKQEKERVEKILSEIQGPNPFKYIKVDNE